MARYDSADLFTPYTLLLTFLCLSSAFLSLVRDSYKYSLYSVGSPQAIHPLQFTLQLRVGSTSLSLTHHPLATSCDFTALLRFSCVTAFYPSCDSVAFIFCVFRGTCVSVFRVARPIRVIGTRSFHPTLPLRSSELAVVVAKGVFQALRGYFVVSCGTR